MCEHNSVFINNTSISINMISFLLPTAHYRTEFNWQGWAHIKPTISTTITIILELTPLRRCGINKMREIVPQSAKLDNWDCFYWLSR